MQGRKRNKRGAFHTIAWSASDNLRKEELAKTGEAADTRRRFELDLTELTQEQRQPIVEFAGPNLRIINMTTSVAFEKTYKSQRYLKSYNLNFDAQPALADILAYIEARRTEEAKASAHKAQVDAEENAERERKTTLYNKLYTQVEMLIEASDYDGLNNFNMSDVGNWSPPRKDSLLKIRHEAMAEIKARHAASEKWQWISEHGSNHLQQCAERGYDCQRLYVLERAAVEAPGFTVDFNDSSDWKDRSCPTEEAIQAEIEAEALALTASMPKVVWLTSAPSHDVSDAYGYYDQPEPFEPCEAVVIRRYLDKYDLVQVI